MIISDLNYLEIVDASIEGGFNETDTVSINFNTNNSFYTSVNSPKTYSNSAAAGAKGVANNYTYYPTYSFTKADTLAVADFGGGSFSASTSVAVINSVFH
ncbi:hypothetical protein [Stenomitos frigidus]|uniref:Uncharacterized protein n=1 Tax=Stenomitos frigidus ULC18 TaxID=2107698 RepID=A0A2T1DTD8_9CYAN|nr:hypothetical protein [Stenomitos frigidus]PSB23740.1 hypothetical protein C7B82_29860 [Stenomitos frigidus ULC18]